MMTQGKTIKVLIKYEVVLGKCTNKKQAIDDVINTIETALIDGKYNSHHNISVVAQIVANKNQN